MKKETLTQYLARGGEIKPLPYLHNEDPQPMRINVPPRQGWNGVIDTCYLEHSVLIGLQGCLDHGIGNPENIQQAIDLEETRLDLLTHKDNDLYAKKIAEFNARKQAFSLVSLADAYREFSRDSETDGSARFWDSLQSQVLLKVANVFSAERTENERTKVLYCAEQLPHAWEILNRAGLIDRNASQPDDKGWIARDIMIPTHNYNERKTFNALYGKTYTVRDGERENNDGEHGLDFSSYGVQSEFSLEGATSGKIETETFEATTKQQWKNGMWKKGTKALAKPKVIKFAVGYSKPYGKTSATGKFILRPATKRMLRPVDLKPFQAAIGGHRALLIK